MVRRIFKKARIPIIAASLVLGVTIEAQAGQCGNLGVTVVLPAAHRQELIQTLEQLSSIPLFAGEIIDSGVWSRVEVCTSRDYAHRSAITSFDIAKKLLMMAEGFGKQWDIRSIQARYQR